jgi:hypothetical protein
MRSPEMEVEYLVLPIWPLGGEIDDETSEGVMAPGAWPKSSGAKGTGG